MQFRQVGLEGYLCGISRNPYIGKEHRMKAVSIPNIKIFFSEDKTSARFILYKGRKNLSVIQIELGDFPTIMNMYTLEKYRRHGFGELLYFIALKLFPNTKFSQNLSESGQAFMSKMIARKEFIKNNK